jgi:phospho-N-acetylmuramoyl-pentapeptide-transferase
MAIYLLTLFTSFIFNFLLIIPFINLLYKLKLQRAHQTTKDVFNKRTLIFDRFNKKKAGTPVGGGILLIPTTIFMFILFYLLFFVLDRKIISNYQSIFTEIKILLFTFVSFAFLGLCDDLEKIFFWKNNFSFGLRFRYKLIIELILALIISFWLYNELKVDIVNVPFFGVYKISILYILFSTFVIIAFTNAVNITDGLDGLASGILMIALFGFWVVSRAILDTPLLIFISVWLGGLIAFLYFNIYPARIFLGDTGSLSFGATFAVIGLLLGKNFALPIIGAFFVIEIFTSLIQLLSKKFFYKKIFPVAPFHLWLQLRGWKEPKIVMRAWIISVMFTVFGLMVAFMK